VQRLRKHDQALRRRTAQAQAIAATGTFPERCALCYRFVNPLFTGGREQL